MADTSKSAAATSTKQQTGAQPDPLIGRVLKDRFKIMSVIARGGMGKVYKAEQAPLGRICAVKVLNPNYAGDNDPEFHKRFFLEASIASKLSHPNTVTIFDYGQEEDLYFMAMEYLEGRTLHRVIRDAAPLDVDRVLHITRQVCRSLREAHALGVIHRDLKPANIFLIQHDEEDDHVKVLDFGLVKNVDDSENLTQTGLFMGSPKYMAPEQIRGEKVDARTDIYAFGVVMYEMLTGKVPFDKGNSVNTLMAHVSDPVPPMHEMNPQAVIPPTISELVYRCVQKRPEDRYASMDEVLGAIKRATGAATGEFRATGEYGSASHAISAEALAAMAAGNGSHSSAGLSIPPGATSQSGPIVSSGARGSLDTTSPNGDGLNTPFGMARSTTATEVTQKKSKTGLIAAVGLVAALGVGGILMLRSRGSENTNSQHNTSVNSTTPSNSASQTVHVDLRSTPDGAEVFEGTTRLGQTPLTLDWSGAQGDPSRSHTFTFRMGNFQESTVTLTGAQLQHSAVLQPVSQTQPNNTPTPNVGPGPAVNTQPQNAQQNTQPNVQPNTQPNNPVRPRPPVVVRPRPQPPRPGLPAGYRPIEW